MDGLHALYVTPCSSAERNDGIGDHLPVRGHKGEVLGYRLGYEQPIERIAVQGRQDSKTCRMSRREVEPSRSEVLYKFGATVTHRQLAQLTFDLDLRNRYWRHEQVVAGVLQCGDGIGGEALRRLVGPEQDMCVEQQ